MDRRGNSSVPPSNSFYFQLLPSYFKVEHAFAKAMKPNTSYRLAIFKGISNHIKASRKLTKWQSPSRPNSLGGRYFSSQFLLTFPSPSIPLPETSNSPLKFSRPNPTKASVKSPLTKLNQAISSKNSRTMILFAVKKKLISFKAFHLYSTFSSTTPSLSLRRLSKNTDKNQKLKPEDLNHQGEISLLRIFRKAISCLKLDPWIKGKYQGKEDMMGD